MHPAALVPVVYLGVVTVPLVLTDIREHRLPNLYTVPGIGLGILAAAAQWSLTPLVAGGVYGGLMLLLTIGGGVGMGDVKLALLIGLAAGTGTLTAAVAAFLLGGVAASVALITRGRRVRIAFGPWMLTGYWIAVGVWLGSGTAGISP